MIVRRDVIFAMALLAFSSPAFAQTSTAPQRPDALVRGLLDAMRANDAARIRTAFAPTASQAYGDAAPKSGEAFWRWLQSDIIDRQGRVDEPRLTVTNDEVVVSGQYSNNAGYASPANFLFKVRDGQIVSWQMRY
jgi:hypothetical protein